MMGIIVMVQFSYSITLAGYTLRTLSATQLKGSAISSSLCYLIFELLAQCNVAIS